LSRPIFWQASKLINGDKKSKTVEFLPVLTKKSDGPIKDVLPVFLTRMFALSPSLPDILYSHKTALRYLKRFFGLYGDVYHYDFHCEIHDVDAFKTLLDTCRVLLWGQDYKELGLEGKQRKFLFSFDYWVENSGDWATDEVTNLSAQTPLRVLLPLLLDTLRKLRQDVLAAKYYWRYKDRTYLRLVYENRIPDDSTQQTIQEWGCKFDEYQHNPIGFSYFEMSSSI
jgi:hypothetical protein